jgi:hypothetical protein
MENSLTIITPCSRQQNLHELYNSLHFDKIHTWIIVYDTTKSVCTKMYNHPQIREEFCNDHGISGNPQRNHGMKLVSNGYIYFLDDDNIVHPDFWTLERTPHNFYTFDQFRLVHGKLKLLRGKTIQTCKIDTAMFLIHKKHTSGVVWKNELYNADGDFITDIYKNNKDKWVYKNKILCYYNYLNGK